MIAQVIDPRTLLMSATGLFVRIDFGAGERLGPGKIQLLESIRTHGSISAAARAIGMSYRRAWLLVENLNALFGEASVATRVGRTQGGGAVLTPFGERLVQLFREIEVEAARANRAALAELERARVSRPRSGGSARAVD